MAAPRLGDEDAEAGASAAAEAAAEPAAAGAEEEEDAPKRVSFAEEQEEIEEPEITWDFIKSKLRIDSAGASAPLFLDLFEQRYGVRTAAEAMSHVKEFLGDYMVQEFDYQDFCMQMGTASAKVLEDEAAWSAHVAKNINGDVGGAATLMLRVATAVAKASRLHMSDWRDINQACSGALRAAPACWRLQRELPGPLNDARALKSLQMPSTVDGRDLNPWQSEEGQDLFEKAHGVPWSSVQSLCAKDGKISCCFSGACAALDVTQMEDIAFVQMEATRLSDEALGGGFPAKVIKVGDRVLWEVNAELGKLLVPGVTIEGDWYELESEICFLASLSTVAPGWAR